MLSPDATFYGALNSISAGALPQTQLRRSERSPDPLAEFRGREGVGKEIFTDLDFADDVALLAEMLSVLVLALEVMNKDAKPLGLTINWAKTKIQTTDTIVFLAH